MHQPLKTNGRPKGRLTSFDSLLMTKMDRIFRMNAPPLPPIHHMRIGSEDRVGWFDGETLSSFKSYASQAFFKCNVCLIIYQSPSRRDTRRHPV